MAHRSRKPPSIEGIRKAAKNIAGVAYLSPLMQSSRYSKEFGAEIYFKREDLQQVRSYKIRGAYNKISSLDQNNKKKGIVCASAGNHAQGVAYACNRLGIHGTIYMPTPTPSQKIDQVKMFGGKDTEIVLTGDTFDDAFSQAVEFCHSHKKAFIHPFDDTLVIEGQGTVGLEILDQAHSHPDIVILPIGGGGLAAGVSTIFRDMSPQTTIIGVEPQGAPSMLESFKNGRVTTLNHIDKFVDGAAVKRVGDLTFDVCRNNRVKVITVPEGKVCQTILDLYNKDAIVVEPAGALSIAALDMLSDDIKGKKVVCIISGSNNDITRTAEIKERALLYADLKHYFIVRFPQRAGALKEFVADILGPNDDITHFQYTKKTNRETGVAVVGIQLKNKKDLAPLIKKMKAHNFFGEYLNDKPDIFQYII